MPQGRSTANSSGSDPVIPVSAELSADASALLARSPQNIDVLSTIVQNQNTMLQQLSQAAITSHGHTDALTSSIDTLRQTVSDFSTSAAASIAALNQGTAGLSAGLTQSTQQSAQLSSDVHASLGQIAPSTSLLCHTTSKLTEIDLLK